VKHKTDILDVATRKLAPYMFLFGLYLVSFGDISPGGGFQGGVVIASGVILLVMGRPAGSAERLFPIQRLSLVETLTFLLLLAAGGAGMVIAGSFLADFLGAGAGGTAEAAAAVSALAEAGTPGAAGASGAAVSAGAGLFAPILPGVRFIFLLNVLIGVKVAAGVSLICLHLFGEE
jgi:multicomponent Na+:H+ antiporter subunit B